MQPSLIDVVGHRIVHGGPKYRASVLVTPEVRAGIAEQAQFAPAHNKLQLSAIETVDRVIGTKVPPGRGIRHRIPRHPCTRRLRLSGTLRVARRRHPPLRISRHQRSIFHAARGRAVARFPPNSSRLIVCHLGNGASVTAVKNGKSVDTSMGFTPLEGIMMGTRSGSVDPSILVYLTRSHGYTAVSARSNPQPEIRSAGRFRLFGRRARDPGSHRAKVMTGRGWLMTSTRIG